MKLTEAEVVADLIRREDINRVLWRSGKGLTRTDIAATQELSACWEGLSLLRSRRIPRPRQPLRLGERIEGASQW